MEIVPDNINPRELREEVNSRTHRAGYTSREGGQIPPKIRSMRFSLAGRQNYEKIFGHS